MSRGVFQCSRFKSHHYHKTKRVTGLASFRHQCTLTHAIISPLSCKFSEITCGFQTHAFEGRMETKAKIPHIWDFPLIWDFIDRSRLQTLIFTRVCSPCNVNLLYWPPASPAPSPTFARATVPPSFILLHLVSLAILSTGVHHRFPISWICLAPFLSITVSCAVPGFSLLQLTNLMLSPLLQSQIQ
jgi:hypothetical protein